jgi:hypothetical protein
MRSAPNDLPLAGHPYFGPNTLFHTLQELPPVMIIRQVMATKILLDIDISVNS